MDFYLNTTNIIYSIGNLKKQGQGNKSVTFKTSPDKNVSTKSDIMG